MLCHGAVITQTILQDPGRGVRRQDVPRVPGQPLRPPPLPRRPAGRRQARTQGQAAAHTMRQVSSFTKIDSKLNNYSSSKTNN